MSINRNSDKEPLISVAICTYNGASYILEQLDSILAQDYSRLEIIIVDDASTDYTVEILQSIQDERIVLYQNPINLGYNANFERCLKYCTGDYIAISDQDDIWEIDKLSKMLAGISDSDLIYCDSGVIDGHGNKTGEFFSQRYAMKHNPTVLNLLFSNMISGHAMLFKREILPIVIPFPENFFYDWWITLCLAGKAAKIKYLPEILVWHREHHTAVTDSFFKEESSFRDRLQEKIKNRKYRIHLPSIERLSTIKSCPYLSNDQIKIINIIQRKSIHLLYRKTFSFKLFLTYLINLNELFFFRKKDRKSNLNYAWKQSKSF